jgi:hypothetical protein
LVTQQSLQTFDVADGIAQDLHLWQSLVRVAGCAALERLESLINFAQAAALAHGGCLAAVGIGGFALARLAGPQ